MDDIEVWRSVVGYEKTYEVSDSFRVRRIVGGRGARVGRILKQSLDSHGYSCVHLYYHGKGKTHKVANLVANAFLPPKCSTDQVLRHLNDDPADNRIENLAWGTYSDNTQDAIRNGKWCPAKGATHCCAKLTEDDVREIRLLYATGNFLQRELAWRFGVSKMTISDIVRRKTWKHIV